MDRRHLLTAGPIAAATAAAGLLATADIADARSPRLLPIGATFEGPIPERTHWVDQQRRPVHLIAAVHEIDRDDAIVAVWLVAVDRLRGGATVREALRLVTRFDADAKLREVVKAHGAQSLDATLVPVTYRRRVSVIARRTYPELWGR
jgi:hypothetical protein